MYKLIAFAETQIAVSNESEDSYHSARSEREEWDEYMRRKAIEDAALANDMVGANYIEFKPVACFKIFIKELVCMPVAVLNWFFTN